jgi:DNA invertase Pin-like site-specific DNA recombinase
MGCEVVGVYTDQGISGAKGRDQRPQFDALCKAATRREFDIVMAWSVDRLSRSVTDLCTFLTEIDALEIDLYLHSQGLDTSTPMGKAMFQIAGVCRARALNSEGAHHGWHCPRAGRRH